MKNLNVLDERKIEFDVKEEKLFVYDQNKLLVGVKPLPIPTENVTTSVELYKIASECGYDIDLMLTNILIEAVKIDHKYDIWFKETEIEYFSPKYQQWVTEIYQEGSIFDWLEKYFNKKIDK